MRRSHCLINPKKSATPCNQQDIVNYEDGSPVIVESYEWENYHYENNRKICIELDLDDLNSITAKYI